MFRCRREGESRGYRVQFVFGTLTLNALFFKGAILIYTKVFRR